MKTIYIPFIVLGAVTVICFWANDPITHRILGTQILSASLIVLASWLLARIFQKFIAPVNYRLNAAKLVLLLASGALLLWFVIADVRSIGGTFEAFKETAVSNLQKENIPYWRVRPSWWVALVGWLLFLDIGLLRTKK